MLIEDLRDCEFLFASGLGIDCFPLRGGSSDCVLVGVSIQSAGVAQLLDFKIPSSKSLHEALGRTSLQLLLHVMYRVLLAC